MSDLKKHPFLRILCEHLFLIQGVFLISIVFLVFSIVSFAVVDPGSSAYVITVLNLAALIPFTAVTGGLIWYCGN